jgi:hypothetical protein
MKYRIVEVTSWDSMSDNVSVRHSADNLQDAIKYQTALQMLPHNKNVKFDIVISISDTFEYMKACENNADDKKVINL